MTGIPYDRVRDLIADVLDISPDSIGGETSRGDIPEWDSLAHLRLMTAFEEEFGVRPSMAQISGIQTVADLVALAQGAKT